MMSYNYNCALCQSMNEFGFAFYWDLNLICMTESELLYGLQLCIVTLYVISLVLVLSVTFEIND